MKKAIILLSIYFFCQYTIVFAQNTKEKSTPTDRKEIKIIQNVLKILNEKHIAPRKLDDVFSKQMFKTYIDSLDRERLFFLQSDIDEFKQYETKLDDQLKNNDLSFFDLTRKKHAARMAEAKEIYTNILKNELDFSIVEFQKNNFDNFAIDKEELISNWRKFLKRATLEDDFSKFNESISIQKFNEIISDFTQNKLLKNIESSYYNVDNISSNTLLNTYLYSIISVFDKQTIFISKEDLTSFFNKQNKKINGYGFNCVLKDDYIKINEIYTGGPAWKEKIISIDDVVLKIGLENNTLVNITGFLMADVIKLLKSKPHNSVKLTLKKPNGSIIEVTIKRGVVSRDDSYVKSAIVTKNNVKFGFISFSRFYNEVDEEELKNDANDFKKEIQTLQKNNAKGLLIDLRNNNGGNIESVLKILTNFITDKIVLQYKTNDNIVKTLQTDSNLTTWTDGIIILVNKNTAGAAEILANTFKEFQIGIVIGENTSGKATSEELINFGKYNNTNESESDNLLITTQKFYGLNGKSIENIGIKPDVNFAVTMSQKKLDNIKIDFVKPILFKTTNTENYFKPVFKNSKTRLDKNEIYKFLTSVNFKNEIANIKTLQAKQFKKEYDLLLEKRKKSGLTDYSNKLEFLPITKIENALKGREYLIEKRKAWLAALSQDFIIEEGINILEDMNTLK